MSNKIKKFVICEKCKGNGFFSYELENKVTQFEEQNHRVGRITKVRERCTVCQGTGHTGSYLVGEEENN
tara:strand:- start:838 stop:1044 length:207 start_codon:yes stop_codon:yes gene_type:complete